MSVNYLFQHDHEPEHTSGFVKYWLSVQNINVLDWPSQSFDLNVNENLWAFVKDKSPRNNDELF